MAAVKDAVLERAVDLAREVALEIAAEPEDVGEYLGAVRESERLVSHRFACTARGYRGWAWTVTVARVPRGRTATVCEAELLPGEDAILAKPWVPWSERLRPGDIGPGDVLPFRPDDPRLEPGYTPTGDPEVDEVAIDELALARVRVLSPQGREEAAQRWYRGSRGPSTPGAVASAGACWSCGFMVPLQGSLGQLFAVCANEWSPDDGKVVSLDHGCGAHSETDVEQGPSEWPAPDPLLDELAVDVVERGSSADDAPEAPAADVAEAPAEGVVETVDAPAGEQVDEAAAEPAEAPAAETAEPAADAAEPVVDESSAEPVAAEPVAEPVADEPAPADEPATGE